MQLSIRRSLGLLGACLTLLAAAVPACAHTIASATLSGSVADSTGAMVQQAEARLVSADASHAADVTPQLTTERGTFLFHSVPGRYRVTVHAAGFAVYTSGLLDLRSGAALHLTVRLEVARLEQQLMVGNDGIPTGALDGNSLVLQGDALQMLSGDRRTLEQQLKALTGTTGDLHFLVDGFTGTRLPPKSAIRAIRINPNPFSPYYQSYSSGGIEIDTRPGADTLHGAVNFSGTDQPWDARNPYAPSQPPFYDFQTDNNLNGPLGKRASYFAAATVEQLANNAIVNAASPANPSVLLSTTVPSPELTQTYSLRLDRQFGEGNFGFLRDEWSADAATNSGIQPLVLPEAAFHSQLRTNALQLAVTQSVGAHAVNQLRLQYSRIRLEREPNSTAPAVFVQGSFQAGGSPAQSLRDNQDNTELQDLLQLDRGKHALQAGLRLQLFRDSNRSAAGYNGQYIFPDVASYLAGRASQYSQTVGQQGATLLDSVLALYALDDWRARANLTLTYGLRFESQSAIPDHVDPAPRLGFSWTVLHGKQHTPLLTLRGGYGLFFDHFPDAQLIQSIRQDGTRQVAYLTQNTAFDPNGPPPGLVLSSAQPTIFRVNPALRSAYQQVGSLSVQRVLGTYGVVNASIVYGHYTHSYLTRNLNAPLPGTVTPGDPASGVRPFGDRNIYQFSADGNGNLERFQVGYQLRPSPRLFLFGILNVDKNYTETDGVQSFPSNQYDLRIDYGRSADTPAVLYNGGLQFTAPWGLQVTPYLVAHSGMPFNLTTGTDLNGDTLYNDRPAFADGQAPATAVATVLGNFNVQPIPGQTVLPRNYARSPGYAWLQLRVIKDFHLGPLPKTSAAPAGAPAAPPQRPWDLSVSVEVHNLTNRNNPGLPIGVIAAQPASPGSTLVPSAYFGRSLSLAPDFSPVTASNRTILLQTSFSW